jgi:glutathione synthase
MRIGFLMDPVEGLQVGHDSTFALMLAARARGHEVVSFEQPSLEFDGGRVVARLRRLEVRRERGAHFTVLSEERRPVSDLDVVFLRKDPPVDSAFLRATQMLELVRPRPVYLNEPAALREANEKLFALHLAALGPPTLVSSDPGRLAAFVRASTAGAILKPVDGFAGRGVVRTHGEAPNLASLIEILSARGAESIIAQAYLPESRAGDKRVIVLDGEPVGAVLRVPRKDDVRCNFAAGGSAAPATVDGDDRRICRELAPLLLARGLRLVGIDVIGGRLIEVNVTSPTGLEEIAATGGGDIAARVIARVEECLAERASPAA